MCLGVPGKIIQRFQRDSIEMGLIDFGGVTREVCLAATPEAAVGEYVIVHAGFALSVLSESEAQETLALLRELGEVEAALDCKEEE
ncbi:MAG TPA: HypC/HybG/HupF family hydrogenase formation chaperone [Bellilinea sp.]|nr:HypC/HybG/HupF family hydrogenase formation chaperone [Bellilinea sp.]